MDSCLRMSIRTSTPVPYWLSRSINELTEWIQSLLDIQEKGGGAVGQ